MKKEIINLDVKQIIYDFTEFDIFKAITNYYKIDKTIPHEYYILYPDKDSDFEERFRIILKYSKGKTKTDSG